MSAVHYIGSGGPACGAKDARWCTVLPEAVTCAACRRGLEAAGIALGPIREEPTATPMPFAMPAVRGAR